MAEDAWNWTANYSKEAYKTTSKAINDTSKDVSVAYAPQISEAGRQYEQFQNTYVYGYVNEEVKDETSIRFITEFERTLPLKEIALVEFERRIKKLVTPRMKDLVTVEMLIECFKDHHAFKGIEMPGTLAHDLMFGDMFLYD